MYGLVNKAIQDLVITQFGKEKWDEIKLKANIEELSFICMNPYPDKITYDLVGAASEVLGLSPDKILEAFGEYWTIYTAREGYGEMFNLAGDNFVEFVQNLDNLHARVLLSFPKLKPPSFCCSDITEESLRLHYYSDRAGLTPMIIGLLKGLGKLFDTEVNISLDKTRTNGHDHDEFMIYFKKA